jgi:hypothetical protein
LGLLLGVLLLAVPPPLGVAVGLTSGRGRVDVNGGVDVDDIDYGDGATLEFRERNCDCGGREGADNDCGPHCCLVLSMEAVVVLVSCLLLLGSLITEE